MGKSGFIPIVMALWACVLLSGMFQQVSAAASAEEVAALNKLRALFSTSNDMNWGVGDPCLNNWMGVNCDPSNGTVIQLFLDNKDLKGTIPSAIGGLINLTTLELSNNRDLTGPLPREIGDLTSLGTLSIQYCGLNGTLPAEVGNLRQLHFLGLNGNRFSGQLPAKLGNTRLTWLDISGNGFNGEIPLARNSLDSIGLDNLTSIVHFHMNNNSFTGSVPEEFFGLSALEHLLVDHNNLTGQLPNVTIPPKLRVIRVDYNYLGGEIPSVYERATNLTDLNFKQNLFSGSVPNLTALQNLNFLDLSQNDFTPDFVPSWASGFPNIKTMNLADINLVGNVPSEIFTIRTIEKFMEELLASTHVGVSRGTDGRKWILTTMGRDLSSNELNGTLTFSGTTGSSLIEVNLTQNNLSGFAGNPRPSGSTTLFITLVDNPICENSFVRPLTGCTDSSDVWEHPATDKCSDNCSRGRKLNRYTCICSFPLEVVLLLTAPAFSNLKDATRGLENNLAGRLILQPNQTYISNMTYLVDARVNVTVLIFPVQGDDTLPKEKQDNITESLRHHLFELPEGPYLMPQAIIIVATGKNGLSTATIILIAVGCTLGFVIIAGSIFLAIYHKKRADKAVLNNPFASWGGGSAEFGEAPKLKGARWFSLAELKAYTDNWNQDNQIGVGGYGRVYRGLLPTGDLVAIKRATEGSMQGANEFKNEIELLSRVHHRNLLGLVGFCYEGGEQALVYEFMSNGTLDDHLRGDRAGTALSWEWRLEIALASARGIAYLHDMASPPIIHRDIKSPNILLNDNLVAKVADFGLSKLAPDEGEKLVHSLHVKGTLGYLDPEYYMTQNLTDKSDVYSFGVVLLELLTARPPIDGGKFVVREVRVALDKGGVAALRPLLDPAISNSPMVDLEAYLAIALSCVEEDGSSRPTTGEIVKKLEALDAFAQPKSGMHAMDIESGGKKVKFADRDHFINDGDHAELLGNKSPSDTSYRYQNANNSFQYSGQYGVSTTVKPK